MKVNNFEAIMQNEIDMYGVKWRILAESHVDENDSEEYLDVFLYAIHNFERK